MAISIFLRTTRLAALLALALLAFGWTSAQAQEPDPAKLETGAQLFAENCAVCHGAHGEGRVGATLAKDWPSIRPDLTVKSTISNGIDNTVMPAWSQKNGGPFSDDQIDALTQYILSWQTGGAPIIPPTRAVTPRPPIQPPANVEGDPNHGALLFDQNCKVCHGQNGEGRIGATLSKDWPSIRPDLTVKNTISNGIDNTVMPSWSQANGGPLSEAEINDLTAFVLSLPGDTPSAGTAPQPFSRSTMPWLTGWGGVAVAVILFVLIIAAAYWYQQRRPS